MSAIARDALQLLMAPGAVHELRVPEGGRDGTIAGYFDDRDKLARTAAELDGRYPGIYLTLNPCNPALLARSNNRVKSRAKQTTSDADTAQRRWFALDFDPVRPGGVSSTDYEHDRYRCGVWRLERATYCRMG